MTSNRKRTPSKTTCNTALALVAAMCLVAGSASAAAMIELIWADTGTSTLTLPAPGEQNLGGSNCHGGAGPQDGYCLRVILTTDNVNVIGTPTNWKGISTTLGWNHLNSGIGVSYLPPNSFDPGSIIDANGGVVLPIAPLFPLFSLPLPECPGCTIGAGSFAALADPFYGVTAGTYLIGSISFDLSGAPVGTHTILNFWRPGIDGFVDIEDFFNPVDLLPATIEVIPEPGTASLLGLGIAGLAFASGRRKR